MEEPKYPAIQNLKNIYEDYEIKIIVSSNDFIAGNKDYPAVLLSINNHSFRLFVEDEYKDFQIGSPLLSLCLVLRELEGFKNADNYIDWCKESELESSNYQVSEYYKDLQKYYFEIKTLLGEIDSQISNYDFGLNAGAARKLRKLD